MGLGGEWGRGRKSGCFVATRGRLVVEKKRRLPFGLSESMAGAVMDHIKSGPTP